MKPLKIVTNNSNQVFNGFLLVDKPKGMTSNDLCQILKKRYNIKACGHVGTLDPDATGLMVLAFGRATKLLPFLDTDTKKYIATIVFGKETTTLDMSGDIIAEKKADFNQDDLIKAIDEILAKETQLPPLTSAIKVNGKKLLEYQKDNIDVDIKERKVKLYNYKILRNLYNEEKELQVDLILTVSKGYYIRSFARDLGYALNTYGAIKELKRIEVGEYKINDSYPLEELLNKEISLIEITKFIKYAKINIKERILNFVLNGVTLYERNLKYDSDATDISSLKRFIIYYDNKPISIYEKQNDIYRPIFKF